MNDLARERAAAHIGQELLRGREYAARMAQEPDARQTRSGLIHRELRAGDGARPLAVSAVRVNYRGTLLDGTEFDSSYEHAPTALRTQLREALRASGKWSARGPRSSAAGQAIAAQ